MFYKPIHKLRFFINDFKRLISIPFPVSTFDYNFEAKLSSLNCWFPVQLELLLEGESAIAGLNSFSND